MEKIIFLCLFSLVFATPLRAAVIMQDGKSYVAFEAEDNFTPNVSSYPWTIITGSQGTRYTHNGASQDKALLASGASGTRGTATYQLQFTQAGNYYLYVRVTSDEKPVSGTTTPPSVWFLWNTVQTDIHLSSGDWHSTKNYVWMRSLDPYNVANTDLTQALSPTLKIHNAAVMVDRLVFATSDDMLNSTSTLDGLANSPVLTPEPAAGIVLLSFCLLFAGRRRRYD